jgi:cell division protein FtsB
MKRIIFYILFLGLLVSFGNEGWFKFLKLKKFEQSLQDQNQLLAEQNVVLTKSIEDLKDPKYLEHYIRQELGFVRGDEILYEFGQTP